jgi:DNA-binding NarL/FixJ family response regulator
MVIRVLLSHKKNVMAQGISAHLNLHPDLQLIGVEESANAMLESCIQEQPDVALLGIESPLVNGLQCIRRLSHGCARTRIAVLANYQHQYEVLNTLDAGATSCISTASRMEDLTQGIRAAASGTHYLCRVFSNMVLDHANSQGDHGWQDRQRLGDREEEVLCLIADGYSSKEIARRLQIAPSTVDVHRRNIMRKIGLHKVADLTRFAIRHQMVTL